MSMTLVIAFNIVMSLLAFGAVGAGILISRRLNPGPPAPPNEGGRAHGRGLSSRRLRPRQRIAASIATATNSSAR
jgi:hypothetical protein